MIKKRLKRDFVVSAASIICLSCLLSPGVKAEAGEQGNKLIIDLIKLAPYAQWNNYYGKIKFGHYQEKNGCALYSDGASWDSSRGYDRKERKKSGKDETKSIFIRAFRKSGYVRAKYPLYLPRAEQLLFESKVVGHHINVYEIPASVGYILEGEGAKYLASWNGSIKCDFTHLSGKKCNLLLKMTPWTTNWNNARLIAFYLERGKQDLAISPSDIEVVPLADGKVNIELTIHNIAETDAGRFHVDLYDGDDLLLGKKEVAALKGKEKVSLIWRSLEISEGKHELIARINSSTEENSKENNSAALICRFPVWGIMFKDIEGYPYNWQAQEVEINLHNNLADAADYRLECKILDYWDKEIKRINCPIPANVDTVTLKPFDNERIGWWKMEASIIYKDKIVDSLSTFFCQVPMPPAKARSGSIFSAWNSIWDPTPQMIKDIGASYAQCEWYQDDEKRSLEIIDRLIKNGQIPYVYVLGDLIFKKMELSKMVEEAKKHGYKAASKYSHKETGIWWYIMGEQNNKISPRDYAAVVKAFYEGAVKADPDVRIATMELTHGQPSLLDSGKRGTRYEWLAEMYPQARGYFHAVGNNHYSHQLPEEPFHNTTVKPCMDVIEKHGDLGKIQMHCQEGNLPAKVGGGTIAASMVRMYLYQLGLGERGASIITWYCMKDCWTPITFQRRGLCKYNHHPRPTYQAYAVMTQNLTGAKFIEKKDIGKDSYCYVFKKGRDTLACLWKGKGEKEVIVVPAKREVELTNLMGEVTRIKPEKGEVKLTISFDPIYVRGLNLRRFKVISRHLYFAKVLFEDEYSDASRLLTDKSMKSSVYYKVAKAKWLNGESGIEELIGEGLKAAPYKVLPAKDTVIAKYFSKPVTLDGELSEWKGLPSYNAFGSEHRTGSGKRIKAADLSYTFQAGWDKDNLYLAFNVKDDVVISKYHSRIIDGWGGDCIEVYLDVLCKRSLKPGMEFILYYFGLNNKIGRRPPGKILTRMEWKKTKHGYNMEIAFPLKEMFLEGIKPDYRIAFNVYTNDSDEPGKVKGVMWRREGFVGFTARGAGDLLFVGETQ